MTNIRHLPKICVYKITNPKKRVYIGSTINLGARIKYYKGLCCKSQPRLYRSFIKHGFDKHKIEILCECDLIDVRQKEAYYGHLYNCLGEHGLNCNLPPHGQGFTCASEETRKKISVFQKGRKATEETKRKMAISGLGKFFSQETRNKISKSNTGKKLSQERKNRLSEIMMGHKPSKESTIKGALARCHILLHKETGIYYFGINEAAFSMGISSAALRNRLWRKTEIPFIIVR